MNDSGRLRVFLVVGEESGDQLGVRLMTALRSRLGDAVEFAGVGGDRMAAEGLPSLFALHDIAVMGIGPVLRRLPTLLKRIRQTAEAAIAASPDVVVIIDSPDFTHRVASRIRKARPDLPIVDYVSPSVWAWRSGRARKMAAYVTHLLALLPFEPEVHRRLGGPATTYVGHPLIDRPELLRSQPGERPAIEATAVPTLLVLPGSRGGEIDRMLGLYGQVVRQLAERGIRFKVVIPAVERLAARIAEETGAWAVHPEIVRGEAEKFAAFRSAHAALATSGTVTLELALAGVPTVVAYARDPLFRVVTEIIRRIPGQVSVSSMVLPNIILGQNVIPEFLDPDLDPAKLADALAELLQPSPARAAQSDAMERLWAVMALPNGKRAADTAADIVLSLVRPG
ncbi:lipid-A-disaccharide synthase [Oryzibacter oryziterrae]|uniref:lipid-A-disaccharide synthase n=1 Tax=Oryzibacter oryziterrae TaxID=2766474 RepID=UPI001EFF9F4D|nr:lipid-A-disaccharide synthase [Oryzibacter oryziterrae]